jgi:hypothetical protein
VAIEDRRVPVNLCQARNSYGGVPQSGPGDRMKLIGWLRSLFGKKPARIREDRYQKSEKDTEEEEEEAEVEELVALDII